MEAQMSNILVWHAWSNWLQIKNLPLPWAHCGWSFHPCHFFIGGCMACQHGYIVKELSRQLLLGCLHTCDWKSGSRRGSDNEDFTVCIVDVLVGSRSSRAYHSYRVSFLAAKTPLRGLSLHQVCSMRTVYQELCIGKGRVTGRTTTKFAQPVRANWHARNCNVSTYPILCRTEVNCSYKLVLAPLGHGTRATRKMYLKVKSCRVMNLNRLLTVEQVITWAYVAD